MVDSGNGVYYICWDIVNITPNHVYLRKMNATFDDAVGPTTEITSGLGTPTDYKEGMWFVRQNNLWYLFYAHWPTSAERIAYSTATNLLGPYTFRGDLMNENTNSATIHPGICFFNNRWIMFWHCGGNELGGSITTNAKRVSGAEYFYFNTSTTPWSINAANTIPKTRRGVGTPNAYRDTIQVDRRSATSNAIDSVVVGGEPPGWMVTRITNNAWVRYDTIDFTPDSGQTGPVRVSLRIASTVATDTIEVRLGSNTSTLLCRLPVPSTGSLTTWRTIFDTVTTRVSGIRNLALVFRVPTGSNNLRVNWAQFSQERLTTKAEHSAARSAPPHPFFERKKRDRILARLPYEGAPARVRVLTLQGKVVPIVVRSLPGRRSVEVQLPGRRLSGTYLLSVTCGNSVRENRFVY